MIRFDHFTLYRLGLIVMLTLTLFACSGGGGCSGCAGCGIQPIPGGYPIAERIDNSAQVRLTSGGIGFIEENIGGIVESLLPTGLDFDIPRTTTDVAVIGTVTVCPDSNCAAHIEIQSLELSPTDPNVLLAHLRLIFDSRDTSGTRAPLPIDLGVTCLVDIDTRRMGSREYIGLSAEIRFASITEPARLGYTRITFDDPATGDSTIGLVSGEGIETADLQVSNESCSGLGCIDPRRLLCTAADLDFVKNMLIDQIAGQISGLTDGIADQLCTTRGDFGCPTGTFSVPDEDPASICRYGMADSDECVPILLGTDGQGDLGGQLIGGFSPGTHAYAQFLLASGGDGEAVNEGMSLFFYGGFRGTDPTYVTTPAHNACVPVTPVPDRPTIPRVDAFRGNVIPGTSTAPHVGIGIAEAYLDYAGWGLFDSGALCIGAGTRLSQQLSTGLLSALIMSIPDLAYPLDGAPITIAIRPQVAPDFTIGTGTETDPLIGVLLPQVQMDFYVWSTERYVRFMTLQTDLDIGINLTVTGGEIIPSIVYVNSNNPVVTNSELLDESPAVLASTLSAIITGFAGMLGGALSPFALPNIMGFDLVVPDGGITRVTDGGQNFLGIFADLALAGPTPYTQPTETSLRVSDLSLDRASMQPEHWNEGAGNSVWLSFAADGVMNVEYEYSYRLDEGPWSSWTTDERVHVSDEILLLQARHVIEARSRVRGEPASTDETPASAEVVVDILPPRVEVARTLAGIDVDAADVITPAAGLEYRYLVDGAWTSWGHGTSLALPTGAEGVSVEVRDESGNVGRAQAALIRGLPNASAAGGCGGCYVSDDETNHLSFGLLALLGFFGAFFFRRRRSSQLPFLGLIGLALIGLLVSGCECGAPQAPCGDSCIAAIPPTITAGAICCEPTDMCVNYDVDGLCDPGYTCPLDSLVLDETCGISCSGCTAKPAISPGILATDLDLVVDDAANVYVSGYNPGNPNQFRLGDLVFGQWNGTAVDWGIVDGAPSTPITNDPDGWRGGVSAPGPDVGRWTSLANQSGTFLITSFDATNGALRFSAGGPGAWASHTVDDTGNSGRYSSLVVMGDGRPAVSYLRMDEDPAAAGMIRGSVMVAMANNMSPSGPTDWTLTEVASAPMLCRPDLCAAGQTCTERGQCVTPSSDCSSTCVSGDTCFMGSCEAALANGYVEDMPPAYGLYTSLAVTSTGLALVYYDRTTGNVFGAAYDGTTWGAPLLIDGYAMADPNVGDCGQGADLAVDTAGVWHVVYIDGAEETLRYAQVQGGAVVSREIVDDGSTSDGATRFTDGRHIIGDDASIVVDPGGGVRVVYQDATSQDAVVAVRAAGGGPWAIARYDSEGSTGYWVGQQLLGTVSYAVTHWRQRTARGDLETGVRVTTLE